MREVTCLPPEIIALKKSMCYGTEKTVAKWYSEI